MPSWVQEGYDDYAKRLPRDCALLLKEISAGKRGKNSDVNRIVQDEGERMLASVPAGAHIVTLDIPGQRWSTEELAISLQRWRETGQAVALMVGGPEGLADSVRQAARESWSLSRLTFPHPLARIIIAEQLYRAWTILNHHPYHRA